MNIIQEIKKSFFSYVVIIVSFFFSFNSHAQDNDWKVFPSKEKKAQRNYSSLSDTNQKDLNFDNVDGKVQVFQDHRIDALTDQLAKNPYIYGYTVQIEVSQQKNVIRDARYKFLNKNPDVPLEEQYEAPNNYLYGGRFYDRISAYKFKQEISDYFPDAIVLRRKMKLPLLPNNSGETGDLIIIDN